MITMSQKDGVVRLWDLPEDSVCIKLPPRFKKGIRYQKVLDVCKELKAESKKITIKNIADKLNRSKKYAAELTLDMCKLRMLKVIKKTPLLGSVIGFSGKEFELVM